MAPAAAMIDAGCPVPLPEPMKLKSVDSITIIATAGNVPRRRVRANAVAQTTELQDRPARVATLAAPAAPKDGTCEAASPEHTAMLNSLRAEWQVAKDASLWRKLEAGLEWRSFWLGHTAGVHSLDREEGAVVIVMYLFAMGLLVFEVARRSMWATNALIH